MGIPAASASSGAPPAHDQATEVISGVFTTTGTSPIWSFYGAFNVVFYETSGGSYTGSVQLERSFDGGTTWIICNIGGGGQQAIYAAGTPISFVASEPEKGVLYRLNCTSLSSASISYRMSTTGVGATAWGIPAS